MINKIQGSEIEIVTDVHKVHFEYTKALYCQAEILWIIIFILFFSLRSLVCRSSYQN
jgi:hypothetical protein